MGYASVTRSESEDSQIYQLNEISTEATSTSSGHRTSFFNRSIKRSNQQGPQADNISSVTEQIPNVAVEQSSVQTRVVIRGMTSVDGGLQDPVGYVVDDVALPLGATQAPYWMNIETIDVVTGAKGDPQGRNAQAGRVLVSSPFPSIENMHWGSYSYLIADGGRDWEPTQALTGGVSGPVSETPASFSLALRHEDSESAYYNLADAGNQQNRRDRTSFSGGWSYYPSDNTDIQFRSHWEDSQGGRAYMRYLDGPFATERFVVNYDTQTEDRRTTSIHSLRVDHSANDVEFVSITGVTRYEQDFTMDLDTGPMVTPATESLLRDRMISQEFRVLSTALDGDLDWSVGSYFYLEDTDSNFTIGMASAHRETRIDQTGAAVFGEADISFSDRFALVPGIRIEQVRKKGYQIITGALSGQYVQVQDYTAFLPKLSAIYQAAPETIIYAAISKGYQPGGYNHTSATDAETFVFGAEDSYSLEIGLQDTYWHQKIAGELVFFYNLIRDKQVVDPLPGNTQRISNAGKAEIFGLEYRIDAALTDKLSLNGVLGWQEAELTEFETRREENGQWIVNDLGGNDLPYSPQLSASVNLNYQFSPNWLLRISSRYSDSFYFDSQNTLEQPDYSTVDVEARYSRGSVYATLSAANILDREIFSRAVGTPAGTVVEDSQPRTLSLLIGYRI